MVRLRRYDWAAAVLFAVAVQGCSRGAGDEPESLAKSCVSGRDCPGGSVCLERICRQLCSGARVCPDGEVCEDGICFPSGDPQAIDECTETTVVEDCQSPGACVTPRCLGGRCDWRQADDGAPCSDDDLCTLDDACMDGLCLGAARLECDDDDPCTADQCVGGQCDFAPASDGSACVHDDGCAAMAECTGGACEITEWVDCEDGDACTVNSCSAGECVVDEILDPQICEGAVSCSGLDDGAGCDDGTHCTADDTCMGGLCSGSWVCDDTWLDAGLEHNCAVLSDGGVACWGNNDRGQLGNGSVDETVGVANPQRALGISGAVAVGLGPDHSCALIEDGRVFCWGHTGYGSWPVSLADEATPGTPVQIPGVTDAIQVAAAASHTCVLRKSGELACWGANYHGQLGDGSSGSDAGLSAPTMVDNGIDDGRWISSLHNHQCVVRSDGGIYCSGYNPYGQLGNGGDTSSPVAVRALSFGDFSRVVVGTNHSCGLESGGSVLCWGLNNNGQIGTGTAGGEVQSPQQVTGLESVVQIDAGWWDDVCAVHAAGTVSCWGQNDHGKLGDGTSSDQPAPVMVSGLSGAVVVATGNNHTCAGKSDGSILCWGSTELGQVGVISETPVATPTAVPVP